MRQRVKIVIKEEIVRELYAIAGEDAVQTAEPMKNHTTFRVGGPADYFVAPHTEEEIRKMLRHLEQMEEYAACGKAYREEVSRNVVKLCGLAQPQISSEVMKRVTEGMSLDDLKVFEKAFRTKAEEVIPLSPQLAVAKEKEYKKNSPNQAFKI